MLQYDTISTLKSKSSYNGCPISIESDFEWSAIRFGEPNCLSLESSHLTLAGCLEWISNENMSMTRKNPLEQKFIFFD